MVEFKLDEYRSVFVRAWPDTKTVDISVPNRAMSGFYLRSLKNISMEDAEAIRCCLNQLEEEDILGW
jgi:hypothetical protein